MKIVELTFYFTSSKYLKQKTKYRQIAKVDKNIDFGKIAILSQKSGIFKSIKNKTLL